MENCIEVYEKKKIPRDCSTCLYKSYDGFHCGNANNHGKPMVLVNGGRACGWYWLNQNKYERI